MELSATFPIRIQRFSAFATQREGFAREAQETERDFRSSDATLRKYIVNFMLFINDKLTTKKQF